MQDMRTNVSAGAFIMGLALFCSACSSRPSVSEGRTKLEADIERDSSGLMRLLSFEKTDGVNREISGLKVYELYYRAEIEFVEDCLWTGGSDASHPFLALQLPPEIEAKVTNEQKEVEAKVAEKLRKRFSITATSVDKNIRVKKGDRKQVTGQLLFKRTERGWHPADDI